MKVDGEPIVYSPEVAEQAIKFQEKMIAYCDKVAVLCNSQFMVNHLNQITQISGAFNKACHIYGKDSDMLDQAYKLLNIHGNELIKPAK